MAHILPDTPPQSMPKEVLRVFRALKSLPDSYYVWHHLAPWQPDAPDFLVINEQGRTLLIKVSSAASDQASTAAQMLLLEDNKKELGRNENVLLENFVGALKLPADQNIETLVIFPNIQHKQAAASRLERRAGEPHWVGKEIVQSDSGLELNQYLLSAPLDPIWLEKLRQHFTPEIVIQPEMTVRQPIERRTQAGLTSYLLDYDQEAAVKTDLELPEDDQSLPSDLRLNIINGVAGSGKTLILLYRLRLLYRLYPNKKFLVLTHNRPLSHDMESRFSRLESRSSGNIEWRTFNAWCYHHWPKQPKWIEPLNTKARKRIIEETWRSHLQKSTISLHMFESELDWFKDQIPLSQDEYLTVDRRGRGFGLNMEQRQRIFGAMQDYQISLQKRGACDWGDVPRLLWQSSETGEVKLPEYDFILVDETQFFAPLWMRLIQKSLTPRSGHLFLVADPTQGFLGRGTTWKSLGLEARGHTHNLRRSYRTTLEIMQFATLLYRLRLGDEADDDILIPDMLNMPNGAFPEIIPLTSPQDETTRVANEVESLVKQGFPKKHLLLLHGDAWGAKNLIQAIDERLGKNAAYDPKDTYPGDYVRVTTLNAGAGLESHIVFLVGLQQLFEEEQSLRLSDEERENLIRDNTRKLYMAATRAGQRLVLTYSGELPEVLKSAIGMK
ncbi:UvrD-helicase domain-containing protein [Candidatus Villigracilis saccharophilus]|uniref:UvrD-helicase domain-containing protein n=1 Tax=Candidatus Villigracilis saccharophilus TaxID=3140684 RepID=UPI003135473D|nr:AAA family ATPase [Anaerolineales bacterium]